jgi:hypothetical protein
MGLTTQKLQFQLVYQDTPHYFEVVNTSGERYCHCGSEKDARNLTDMHPGFSYHKIYLPKTPDTVDVNSVDMGHEKALPAQQILPESQQEPLNL